MHVQQEYYWKHRQRQHRLTVSKIQDKNKTRRQQTTTTKLPQHATVVSELVIVTPQYRKYKTKTKTNRQQQENNNSKQRTTTSTRHYHVSLFFC